MFLPINRGDMNARDWHYLDFLLITGDAYVDHSSFAAAIISRHLEHLGYRVGILAQPDITNDSRFLEMGKPRLGVLISGGNMDSMLCRYSATKNPRHKDDYSPGGKFRRPDYATTVYAQKARELFGDKMPIIIGGIEASLRRFAHYDYWQDVVLPSVLVSSGADLLSYGMGELTTEQIAARLSGGGTVADCHDIAGVAYLTEDDKELPAGSQRIFLPSLAEVIKDKKSFAKAFCLQEQEQNFFDGKALVQKHGDSYLVVNRPQRPLTAEEMDTVYELPYERRWHPSYDKAGGIAAFDEVRFSLTSHRGCFGGCSFCSINFHQGRIIQSRSSESILREAEIICQMPDFKGNIHDVGGPTANFRGQVCQKALKAGPCRNRQCLSPNICPRLPKDSSEYEKLLTDLRKMEGVKKVFVRSGLRFDYALAEKSRSFLHTLCRYHISGQLKIAPEHISDSVLKYMGKPGAASYFDFAREYKQINKLLNKNQHLVSYFMSSHPGCTLAEAARLAAYFHKMNMHPEQVQDFIPTPGTRSTCMYYTELNPYNMEKIYVAKGEHKAMQRALLQAHLPENAELAEKALKLSGKENLAEKLQEKPTEISNKNNKDGTDNKKHSRGKSNPSKGKPKNGKLQNGKPKDAKFKDAKPKDAKFKDVKSKDVKSKDVKPKDVMPQNAKPQNSKPKNAKPKSTKPKNGKSQKGKPQNAKQ